MTAFRVMRHFANENGPHGRVGNGRPWGSREQLRCLLVLQKSSMYHGARGAMTQRHTP
jgi:hypothetical protein